MRVEVEKPRLLWIGALLCAFGGQSGAQPARAAPPSISPEAAGNGELAAGDEFAKSRDYEKATLAYKRAYDLLVAELRELPFKRPVRARVVNEEGARAEMTAIVQRELPRHAIELQSAALVSFGLMGGEVDFENFFMQLLTEEVAGFYDPAQSAIFLIRREPPAERSIIGKIFGAKEFDPEAEKIVVAHEMAHALVDQHFGLDRLAKGARGDDDMTLALSALAEGDATAVMFDEVFRLNGSRGTVYDLDTTRLRGMLELLKGFLPFAGGKTFRNAPAWFRETLLSPYLDGLLFVLAVHQTGGWPAVNEAWRMPPLSTEHILHPDKYLERIDPPLDFDLKQVASAVGPEWRRLGEGVWGQLQLAIWFRTASRSREVTGWGGDRYVVWKGQDGRVATVWRSRWDTPQDAREAVEAIAKVRELRLPSESGELLDMGSTHREGGDAFEILRWRGEDVVWTTGLGPSEAQAATEFALEARPFEKKRPASHKSPKSNKGAKR